MSSLNQNMKSQKTSLLKSKTKRQNQQQNLNDSNKKQKSLKKYSFNENDNISESIEEEDENSKYTKQENSLAQLTQNFLNYIKKKGRINISINELVEDLKVKKRRIYDITNVLQGIGYLEKKGKNEILWIKDNNCINIQNPNNNIISSYSQLKQELDELKSQNENIEENMNKYREEFKLISQKNEFPKYGYITFDDITELSLNEKVNFMIIKAPKGTSINVIDDEESKKAYNKIKTQMENGKIQKDEKLLKTLENLHHIFFTSQDKELKIYKIDEGKINEQLNEGNNNGDDNFFYQNFSGNQNNGNEKNIGFNKLYNEKNSTEKNNQNIFNFNQINIDKNTNKNTNNKQVFNFENNYIKQALNNNKNEESFNAQNNNNFGISSVFKK
jgi:transcription factor E2F3